MSCLDSADKRARPSPRDRLGVEQRSVAVLSESLHRAEALFGS